MINFLFSRSPTPQSPRSPVSRSRSRSSIEGSKSPGARKDNNQRSPSPPRQSSSSTKRRRHKDGADTGRHICEICSCDVEAAKRLYGVLDNCDHILYVIIIKNNFTIGNLFLVVMNVLFHGNDRNTAMLNRKGLKNNSPKKTNRNKSLLAVRCVKYVRHL